MAPNPWLNAAYAVFPQAGAAGHCNDAELEVRCVRGAQGSEEFWVFLGDRPLASGTLRGLSRWAFDAGARSVRFGFDLSGID
jgi:hypothetical protein